MDKITAMLVDDEQEALDYLEILLIECFPELKIVDKVKSSEEAIKKVFKKHPDLILLDIEIDQRNGFDIIRELKKDDHMPHIIFVTAYNQYAVEAFRANALDYLLKPVIPDELKKAVNKFLQVRDKELQKSRIHSMLDSLSLNTNKVRFNTRNGYILLHPNEIVYCQSDGNYSELYLQDNTKKVVCCNLRNLQKLLPTNIFSRISRYYIVNESFLSEVNRKTHTCFLTYNGSRKELAYSSKMAQI